MCPLNRQLQIRALCEIFGPVDVVIKPEEQVAYVRFEKLEDAEEMQRTMDGAKLHNMHRFNCSFGSLGSCRMAAL